MIRCSFLANKELLVVPIFGVHVFARESERNLKDLRALNSSGNLMGTDDLSTPRMNSELKKPPFRRCIGGRPDANSQQIFAGRPPIGHPQYQP